MKFSDFDYILKSIFVLKKQTQKLLLSGLIALIFLGFLPIFVVQAQPTEPQGPAPECEVAITNDNTTIRVSHDNIIKTQPFSVQTEITLDDTQNTQCQTSGGNSYEIKMIMYNTIGNITNCTFTGGGVAASQPKYFKLKQNSAEQRLDVRVNGLSYNNFYQNQAYSGPGNSYGICVSLVKAANRKDESRSYSYYLNNIELSYQTQAFDPTNNPTSWPQTTNVVTEAQATVDNTKSIPGSKLAVQYKAIDGKGLRDKYRLVKTDGDMNFGVTGGLDPISLDWAPNSPQISDGQYLALTERSDYTLALNFDPKFRYTKVYFTDGTKPFNANTACQESTLTESCGALYSDEYRNNNGNKGAPSSNNPGSLPNAEFNPSLKTVGWNKDNYTNKTSADGKPLGTEQIYVIPVLWAQPENTILGLFLLPNGYSAYLMGNNPKKITIEVYETIDHVIDACKAENTTNPDICTADYARYGIGKLSEGIAGSSESESNNTPGNSLYAFIIRLISSVIVWLQSVIYRIFAYIVVPVIKALLSVHPYQDVFVNIIYPGWLILRNLANIFFIVALLVVGLRILFQQAASGAARSFIIRLILMALLVNFSLVIAQGIVGIADTVQSQFLPEDSRVIEALGAKLMVEPLKSFRAETVGETGVFGTGEGKTELSFSDTIKPLILLFLSLASLCCFIAIAGFLLVRLVGLWLLYMLSPIAYVGYVMDETKPYAKRWWTEFIKYATITPVLAFFLNIAALMATLFAGTQNTLFKFNEDDSLSGDVVIGSLTIITHFIVIGVIFAGMKYAQSSGVYGAKQIVDLAQKIPLGVKDFLTDKVASGLEKYGGSAGAKAARTLTAAAKPVDFARALKKSQWDDPGAEREKREAERLGIFTGAKDAGDSNKLGGSLKKAREKMKDFESDTPDYLRSQMDEGFQKKDKDHVAAAMLKMGQEGNFKDMLEQAEELMPGNKYSRDAVGLNKMTEDLVKNGRLTENNRRDLLSEFDSAAKKKKKNVHYAGNVTYDKWKDTLGRDKKGFKVREVNDDGSFRGDSYGEENNYTRSQIKARTGEDDKGSLLSDLYQTDVAAALVKNKDGKDRFTMAQVGVFAAQSEDILYSPKIWKSFKEKNEKKYEKMADVVKDGDGKTEMRKQMVQYYQAVDKDDIDVATDKANARITLIEEGLTFKRGKGDRFDDKKKDKKKKKKKDGSDDDGGGTGTGGTGTGGGGGGGAGTGTGTGTGAGAGTGGGAGTGTTTASVNTTTQTYSMSRPTISTADASAQAEAQQSNPPLNQDPFNPNIDPNSVIPERPGAPPS